MSIGDALRYLVLTILGLVVLVVGMKFWGKQKTEKRIVREMRTLVNPTASFEQIYAADAEKALLRAMAEMNRAETKLGTEPSALIEQVFHGKGEGALFPIEGINDRNYTPDPRETLIKEGLLRNYQHCRTLGLFEDSTALKLLESGDRPQIFKGPAKGSSVHINFIIDPKLSPGVEKLVPNMVIAPPPGARDTGIPNDLQIKQAKSLTNLLQRANLLERVSTDRIVEHYDRLMKPEIIKVEPDPEPQPEIIEVDPDPEPQPEIIEVEPDPQPEPEPAEEEVSDPLPC